MHNLWSRSCPLISSGLTAVAGYVAHNTHFKFGTARAALGNEGARVTTGLTTGLIGLNSF